MAMEKADDPRVQWRVVVAAMPRTSVGCSKNLTDFRWWERKVQHKPQAGRISIRYSGVLTNKTNNKCVCMLLRVYVIKSVCLKTHHPGVDTVADNPGNPPRCGCLYHLRLEIAFVVPVLTIPLGHYILQSHPQLIFENKKHTLQKMPKDDKKMIISPQVRRKQTSV